MRQQSSVRLTIAITADLEIEFRGLVGSVLYE
jgi:hypothetical protein